MDEIVDQMEQLPTVAECYEKWWELQSRVEDFYSEKERHRPPLSQQKEFRQIKNAVIQEAETIRLGEITFEDDTLDQSNEAEKDKDKDVSWDFWTLRIDVQDEYSSLAERDDAVESMRALAESGDVHAQYFMGKLYLDGSLVIPDSEAAMNWFHKASTSGYAPAQYALGKLLLQGKVIDQDKEEGIQWLTQAAEQGHSYAQCLLERQSASTAPEVFLAVTRLLHHMANIFQDNYLPQSGTGLIHADRKLREQLREKRLAHGHKENDHEEQQYGGWNMTMR